MRVEPWLISAGADAADVAIFVSVLTPTEIESDASANRSDEGSKVIGRGCVTYFILDAGRYLRGIYDIS